MRHDLSTVGLVLVLVVSVFAVTASRAGSPPAPADSKVAVLEQTVAQLGGEVAELRARLAQLEQRLAPPEQRPAPAPSPERPGTGELPRVVIDPDGDVIFVPDGDEPYITDPSGRVYKVVPLAPRGGTGARRGAEPRGSGSPKK